MTLITFSPVLYVKDTNKLVHYEKSKLYLIKELPVIKKHFV